MSFLESLTKLLQVFINEQLEYSKYKFMESSNLESNNLQKESNYALEEITEKLSIFPEYYQKHQENNFKFISNNENYNVNLPQAYYQKIYFNYFHPYFSKKLYNKPIDNDYKIPIILLSDKSLISLIVLNVKNISLTEMNIFLFCVFDELCSVLARTKLSLLHFTSTISGQITNKKEVLYDFIKKNDLEKIYLVNIIELSDYKLNKKAELVSNLYLISFDSLINNEASGINTNSSVIQLVLLESVNVKFKVPRELREHHINLDKIIDSKNGMDNHNDKLNNEINKIDSINKTKF